MDIRYLEYRYETAVRNKLLLYVRDQSHTLHFRATMRDILEMIALSYLMVHSL